MTRLSPETVARHISDGVKTIDFLIAASGWSDQEIRRYAMDMGYALNAANGRFRPVPPATTKAGVAASPIQRPTSGPLLANASDRTAPPALASEIRPVHRDLITEGKAHSVMRVQRAAVKAEVALQTLANLLDATRAEEAAKRRAEEEKAAARAEVERLEQQLADAKAKLRGAPKPKPDTVQQKPAGKRAAIGVDYHALDQWCQDTGRDWRKQGMGRPSNVLIAEFNAATQAVAS